MIDESIEREIEEIVIEKEIEEVIEEIVLIEIVTETILKIEGELFVIIVICNILILK